MTAKLRNLVAEYMNKTIDIEGWEDIRKKYFEYSYLAFMTLCAHEIKSDCAANEIENIIGMNDIIEESILCYVLKIPGSYEFISEVLSIINDYDAFDINCLYQSYIAKAMHWIIRMWTLSISRYCFQKRSISPRQEMNQPCMPPMMQRRARTSR